MINVKQIRRNRYLSQIEPFYESPLVKVISGMRRSGKSTLLSQIQDELQKKWNN
jgi:predicted AAA+ superfamily ATPase